MIKYVPIGLIVILALWGLSIYVNSDASDIQDLGKDSHASRKDFNKAPVQVPDTLQDIDGAQGQLAFEYTVEERTVNVTHERTGAELSVNLNVYEDPNFDFAITYPETYSYDITASSVIFRNDDMNMFFAAEVLLSESNGGRFSSMVEVKDNYVGQFDRYEPSMYFDRSARVDGKEVLDFAVKYDLPGFGNYVNRFIISEDVNFFYVLQFNARTLEYENDRALIEEIISDFEFGNN